MRNNCMIGVPPIVAAMVAAMLQFGAASAQETVELARLTKRKPGRRMPVATFTFLRDICHGEL